MTTSAGKAEATENLQPWLKQLRKPELSVDEMLKVYSAWAVDDQYETNLLDGGYQAPALTVKYFCDGFPEEKKSSAKILDIGAGTGLVARGLRSQGFIHIDALDPSEPMLAVAKKDNLYENYFCEFISDKKLPIQSDTYDGLTASGTFGVCHIPCGALHEMIRVVKAGGIIVMVSKEGNAESLEIYKDKLLPLMDSLEEQGKWKKILVEKGLPYVVNETAVCWKYQVL